MSPRNLNPSGEWASVREIPGSTHEYLPRQKDTPQRKPYNDLERGVTSGSHPGPSRHEDPPPQSRETPLVPIRRGDPDLQFGVVDSPQPPSSSWDTSLAVAPASEVPRRPRLACHMNATSSSTLTSRPPLQSKPPLHNLPYPRSTPQPFQQQSYSRLYTPQINLNTSLRPFFPGGTTATKTPGSKNLSGFTAVNPFRVPDKRTRNENTDVIPPSYNDIQVETFQRRGSWPAWQTNNRMSPHPSDQRPYPSSSSSDTPQNESTSSSIPTSSQASDAPATYPPATTPDHAVDPQPQSRPSSPARTESSDLRYPSPDQNPYHKWVISSSPPSKWERMGRFLWPFRHTGKPHRKPAMSSDKEEPDFGNRTVDLVFKIILHQVYLNMLLRLPSLYFARVARIFEDADLSLGELKAMALETGAEGKSVHCFEMAAVPPAYQRLKVTWEGFIDSVVREWKTLNIISALLLSAILAILQIQCAADDLMTRYSAMISLICALVSLLFGCLYIIRFNSMRKTYQAAEWALEAQQSTTVIWWNVWVLLAMPAIWLCWSIVLYIVCIMSFVWRTAPNQGGPPPQGPPQGSPQGPSQGPPQGSSQGSNSPSDESYEILTMRIIITIILGIGLVYGCLIVKTFQRYGDAMDKAWKDRIDGWLREKSASDEASHYHASECSPHTNSPNTSDWSRPSHPITDGRKGAILIVPPSPPQPVDNSHVGNWTTCGLGTG